MGGASANAALTPEPAAETQELDTENAANTAPAWFQDEVANATPPTNDGAENREKEDPGVASATEPPEWFQDDVDPAKLANRTGKDSPSRRRRGSIGVSATDGARS